MHSQPQVPEVAGIDLDFTPTGYFTARDLHLALPSDIQGKARRDLARHLAAQDEALPPELLAPELTADQRRAWGAIHPGMMGGEYLPPMREGEVEIARISLDSVTADQVSVRARRTGDGIAYAIVDEYEEHEGVPDYVPRPATSRAPLSMRELIAMLDDACPRGGAVLNAVVWHVEDGLSGPEEMRGFVSVESDFYPELGAYYAARLDQYLDEHMPEEEADEEDEEERDEDD